MFIEKYIILLLNENVNDLINWTRAHKQSLTGACTVSWWLMWHSVLIGSDVLVYWDHRALIVLSVRPDSSEVHPEATSRLWLCFSFSILVIFPPNDVSCTDNVITSMCVHWRFTVVPGTNTVLLLSLWIKRNHKLMGESNLAYAHLGESNTSSGLDQSHNNYIC